jgi:hypothetical protein
VRIEERQPSDHGAASRVLQKWRDLISDNQQPGSHFPFEFSATTRGTLPPLPFQVLLLRITPPTTPAFAGLCLALEALTVLRRYMLNVGVPSSDCRTPQPSPECGWNSKRHLADVASCFRHLDCRSSLRKPCSPEFDDWTEYRPHKRPAHLYAGKLHDLVSVKRHRTCV